MAKLLQLILLAILLVASSTSLYSQRIRVRPHNASRAWPCPHADDILPCVCSSNQNYNLFLDCSDVLDAQELKNALDGAIFPFTEFLQLTINQEGREQKLDLILRYSFEALTFERIIIKHTNIFAIDEWAFTYSVKSLKYLNLANNKLRAFPFETIPNYAKLDSLIIDDNMFTDLPFISSESLKTLNVNGNMGLKFGDRVFEYAPSLTTIGMSRIGVTELPPNLFRTLNNIKVINLSGNNITELDDLSFNPVRNTIETLTLSKNYISFVRKEAIRGLSGTCSLYFGNNQIIDLTEEVWRPVFDLAINGSVDFSGNRLRCGCDIAWIMLDSGYDKYRPMITETTTCHSGEQLISLDVNYFETQCTKLTTADRQDQNRRQLTATVEDRVAISKSPK